MTAHEHRLICWMFAFQQQKIDLLINILKSREIIEEDDLSAFEFAARADIDANGALAQEVATLWANLCQKSGVPIPEIPKNQSSENQ